MGDPSSRDVDRGWAWVVLLGATLSYALQEGFLISVGIFQVEFLESFSGSQGFVALIGAVSLSSQVMLGPVAGVVTDLVTHRVTILIGGILLSIGLLSASFSPDLTTLLLLFGFVTGVGLGLCYTPSVTVTSTYFQKYRIVANGITLASPGIGLLASPYLLRWLIDSYGWRYAMAIYSCCLAQICVLAALFFPRYSPELNLPCCGPPSGEDPAPTTGDADSLIPPTDQQHKERKVMAGSRSELNPLARPRTELGIITGSGTNLTTRAGSRTKFEAVTGSRTELRSKAGSRTTLGMLMGSMSELGSKAGSRLMLDIMAGSRSELRSKAGSRTTLDIMMGSSLNMSELGSVMLNETVVLAHEEEDGLNTVSERVKRLLCRKFMWVMCLNHFFMMSGPAIHFILFPAYVQSVGVPFKHIPALFIAYGVTIIVSRVSGGFIFSLIPNHLLQVFFCFQVALALALVLLPVYGVSLPGLYVGLILIAATYGPGFLLVTPILLRYVGLTDLSVAFGLVMLSSGVAFVLAPSVAGMTFDVFHSYSVSYYIAGSAVGAAALSLLLLLIIDDIELPSSGDDKEFTLLSSNQRDSDTLSRDPEHEAANGKIVFDKNCEGDAPAVVISNTEELEKYIQNSCS